MAVGSKSQEKDISAQMRWKVGSPNWFGKLADSSATNTNRVGQDTRTANITRVRSTNPDILYAVAYYAEPSSTNALFVLNLDSTTTSGGNVAGKYHSGETILPEEYQSYYVGFLLKKSNNGTMTASDGQYMEVWQK